MESKLNCSSLNESESVFYHHVKFRLCGSLKKGLWLQTLYFLLQDVKLTASNDDYYFVFEDYLYQVCNYFLIRKPRRCTSMRLYHLWKENCLYNAEYSGTNTSAAYTFPSE